MRWLKIIINFIARRGRKMYYLSIDEAYHPECTKVSLQTTAEEFKEITIEKIRPLQILRVLSGLDPETKEPLVDYFVPLRPPEIDQYGHYKAWGFPVAKFLPFTGNIIPVLAFVIKWDIQENHRLAKEILEQNAQLICVANTLSNFCHFGKDTRIFVME